MYFPHAFRKSFLPASTVLASSGTTANLTPGQIGFFDSKTYSAVTTPQASPFILAEGSRYTSNTIGTNVGYKESKKSKVINPKYVSRVMKVMAKSAQNQIVRIDSSGCAGLSCDKTYYLRIDVKGSPALRFLNHNIYRVVDAKTPCCDDENANVDHTPVLLQWADAINNSAYLKDFVIATVWLESETSVSINPTAGSATIVVANADASKFSTGKKVEFDSLAKNSVVVSVGAADSGGTGFTNVVLDKAATSSTDGTATIYSPVSTDTYVSATTGLDAVNSHMDIMTAYIDTKFGTCTFSPLDKYDIEPLLVYTSIVDASGDPCTVQCMTISEVQPPVQASGVGETVLRELILDGRYLQNYYADGMGVNSLRIREIEADPALSLVNRDGLYDKVLILHHIPRFNNPSGTFDNDQYLLVINVPAGTSTTSITNFVVGSCAAAGNSQVVLETF